MHRRGKWIGLVGLLAAFVAPQSFAQDDTGQGSTGSAKPADAEVKFKKTGQLSAAEQTAQAQKYISQMKTILQRAETLARKARKEKDLIKLNCINDKLLRIKGNLRIAEEAREAIRLAAARGDDGDRSHQFSKLTITFQKVTVLGQEAEACIGEEIAYVGKARVTVTVDPDVARQGDPTSEPPPPLPTVRPPVASPFR